MFIARPPQSQMHILENCYFWGTFKEVRLWIWWIIEELLNNSDIKMMEYAWWSKKCIKMLTELFGGIFKASNNLWSTLMHIIIFEAQNQLVDACSYLGSNVGCTICPMPGYDYKSIICSELERGFLCSSTQQLPKDRTRKFVVFLFLCNNTLPLSFHKID